MKALIYEPLTAAAARNGRPPSLKSLWEGDTGFQPVPDLIDHRLEACVTLTPASDTPWDNTDKNGDLSAFIRVIRGYDPVS